MTNIVVSDNLMMTHLVVHNNLIMTHLVISDDQVMTYLVDSYNLMTTHLVISDDLTMTHLLSVKELTNDLDDPMDDESQPGLTTLVVTEVMTLAKNDHQNWTSCLSCCSVCEVLVLLWCPRCSLFYGTNRILILSTF